MFRSGEPVACSWSIGPPTTTSLVALGQADLEQRRKPAAFNRRVASSTPGRMRTSAKYLGTTGLRSRSRLALITPSPSRKTALTTWWRFSAAWDAKPGNARPRPEKLLTAADPGRIDPRDHDHEVALLRRIFRILADDTKHLGRAFLGGVDRLDEIGADVALGVAAATENINIASLAFSRLVSSHAANTVSQPSSLVRAVNSETLSIGL